jgi:large subunit ribosomal protein L25
LEGRNLNRIFSHHGYSGLFSLELEGEPRPILALVREVQRHPVNREINHLDFLEVSMTEKITSNVPIHIIGEEEITKQGAILQSGAKELEVACLPADLPESVICDVSQLQIGEKITVADLAVEANVEKISDPDTVVAVILGASKSTDDETTEEEEATGESEAAE